MNVVLIQAIFGVPAEGDAGWMKLLIIVVIAAFYGLSSLLKSRANKQTQKQREEQSRKLKQKRAAPPVRGLVQARPLRPQSRGTSASPVMRTAQRRPQVQPPRRPTARRQPAAGRPVPQPRVEPQLGVLQPLPEETLVAPLVSKKAKSFRERPVPTKSRSKRPPAAAQVARPGLLSSSLAEFAVFDDLERAILYSEIIGKPKSLRDPSEGIIGL